MFDYEVRRDSFPALVSFLRGYLHQDAIIVHGGAQAAARAFVHDSDPQLCAEVAADAQRLWALLANRPLAEINEALAKLGAYWEFASIQELQRTFAVFGSVPENAA